MDTLPILGAVEEGGSATQSGPYADALRPCVGMRIAERYELVEPLGRGATGWVWKARHVVIGKTMAVKLLSPRSGESFEPEAAARMLREARTLSRIDHPGVIAVTDFGYIEGTTPYIVMELLRGESLRAVLDRGPIPWSQAWTWIMQLLDGLEAAHRYGVIHRDIKPANLFVTDRRIKLLDFGLAAPSRREGPRTRITAVGEVFGTPTTMSPEQASGAPLDARSDLYSLACVLYEMLAGAPPLSGDPAELLYQHMFVDPVPLRSRCGPQVPDHVCELIDRCLAKDPTDRPTSASEVRNALLDEASTASRIIVAAPSESVAKPVRRTRWAAIAFFVALIPPTITGIALSSTAPSTTFEPMQLHVSPIGVSAPGSPALRAELPGFERAAAKVVEPEPEPTSKQPRSRRPKSRAGSRDHESRRRRRGTKKTKRVPLESDEDDIKNPFANKHGR